MAHYIEFDSASGAVLVEVEMEEVAPTPGVVKAGLADKVERGLARAQVTLEQALGAVLQSTAGALVSAAKNLDPPPGETEISFSLKATGELGNIAVCKASAEANYTVTLTWRG